MAPSAAQGSRLDIWDVEKARERKPIHLGFVQGFEKKCAALSACMLGQRCTCGGTARLLC